MTSVFGSKTLSSFSLPRVCCPGTHARRCLLHDLLNERDHRIQRLPGSSAKTALSTFFFGRLTPLAISCEYRLACPTTRLVNSSNFLYAVCLSFSFLALLCLVAVFLRPGRSPKSDT